MGTLEFGSNCFVVTLNIYSSPPGVFTCMSGASPMRYGDYYTFDIQRAGTGVEWDVSIINTRTGEGKTIVLYSHTNDTSGERAGWTYEQLNYYDDLGIWCYAYPCPSGVDQIRISKMQRTHTNGLVTTVTGLQECYADGYGDEHNCILILGGAIYDYVALRVESTVWSGDTFDVYSYYP